MKNFHIAGHLGATPELKTKDDTCWTSLRIAANGKRTDWFWVKVFGKLAESIVEHLRKGDGIAVAGSLRTHKYNDQEKVELIADTATFFGKKGND